MVPDLDALERTVRAELGDAAFDKSYLDGHEADHRRPAVRPRLGRRPY